MQRDTRRRSMFHLIPETDTVKADKSLRNKDAALLVIFERMPPVNWRAQLRVMAQMASITSSGYLEAVLLPVQERREGLHPIVSVESEDLSLHMPQTDFDAFAPGVMIMAILLLIPQTAMLIGRELRAGTIKLLQLSPLAQQNGLPASPGSDGYRGSAGGDHAGYGEALGFHTQGSWAWLWDLPDPQFWFHRPGPAGGLSDPQRQRRHQYRQCIFHAAGVSFRGFLSIQYDSSGDDRWTSTGSFGYPSSYPGNDDSAPVVGQRRRFR